MERIAVAKIAWADSYDGDPTHGRHRYLGKSATVKGHECFNFLKGTDSQYYGYIPPIGKAMVPPKPDIKTGWLVIFVAANMGKGPLTIVGWYSDATFIGAYKSRPEYESSTIFETDEDGNKYLYCISAPHGEMIPLEQRTRTISVGHHLGMTPIAYVKGGPKDAESWRQELAGVAESVVANPPVPSASSGGFPYGTAEYRKKVEEAAVNAVCSLLKKEGYKVKDRQKDNCGYDLLASRGKAPNEIHVEVKGTASEAERFFISRPEREYMRNPKWRLALVTDALGKAQIRMFQSDEVEKEFRFEPMSWMVVGRKRESR